MTKNQLDFKVCVRDFERELRSVYVEPIDERVARLVVRTFLADLVSSAYPNLTKYIAVSPTKKIQQIDGYSAVLSSFLETDSECAAYQLSSFYSRLMCQARRSRDGIYFTPPDLFSCVYDEVLNSYSGDILNAKIFDPCSGGGALLGPFAARVRLGMKKNRISPLNRLTDISNNFHGIDVCKTLCQLSEAFLLIELYSDIARTGVIPKIQIKNDNFLKTKFSGQPFDIMVGNPPFRRLDAREKGQFSSDFGETSTGGSNLYGLFIHKSLNLVRPGGIVSLIVPASLFSGARYAELRSYITNISDVISVKSIEQRDGVFMDVQQEAAVVTMKAVKKGVKRRRYIRVGLVSKGGDTASIGRCGMPKGNSPWIIPKSKKQINVATLFTKNLPTLTDYGIEVRTGSVVWNRDHRKRYATQGYASRSQFSRYPLIWSDCIGVDGTFDFERGNQRAAGELFVKTKPFDPELISTCAIALKRTSNSSQSRRLFCAYINKSFVKNYGAFLGENHVNLLVPNFSANARDLKLLARTLNSSPVDSAFRCISGSSAVSKYELNRLPLPDLDTVGKKLDEGYDINDAVSIGMYE